jgi:hypothetical protein
MTDDIVARLRAGKFNWDCDEAADEIEKGDRLIDDLRHERNVLQKICAERVAEIDRLRMALRYYASDAAWTCAQVEGADGDYGKNARAALEGGKKNG